MSRLTPGTHNHAAHLQMFNRSSLKENQLLMLKMKRKELRKKLKKLTRMRVLLPKEELIEESIEVRMVKKKPKWRKE